MTRTIVESKTKTAIIGFDQPFCVIGERINPTGRKILNEELERGDFSHFLGLYGRDKLPSGGRLRRMMGTFLFAIEGYDHDPREIYTISEVRSFYRAFWEAWPYWMFFTCLVENDALKPMTLCCLDDLSAKQVDGQPMSCASMDMDALNAFLNEGFTHLDDLITLALKPVSRSRRIARKEMLKQEYRSDRESDI